MGWPKNLVLVRHAESVGNVLSGDRRANYAVATHAYPLTERGRRQAEITGKYLRDEYGEFDTYYTSYYRRAQETMSLMYPEARVFEDPRLAEAQRGIWHAMTREEMRECCPWEFDRKDREGLYHYRAPGGENWPDVEMRIHSFLSTVSRDLDGQDVLMVVHGHWLILFQRLIHHFSIDEVLKRYREALFENASVTAYTAGSYKSKPRLVLERQNIVPWKGLV